MQWCGACKGGELRKIKMPLVEPFHQALEVHLKRGGYTLACSVDLQLCKYLLRFSSQLLLVEWFHQKNCSLHAKVWASGIIKCQQFNSHWWTHSTRLRRCTFKREDACWKCWSPARLTCREIFKPIIASGMVPPEKLPNAHKGGGSLGSTKFLQLIGSTRKTTHCKQRWGPQEAQNASSSLVELFHQDLEVHAPQKRRIHAGSVDLQLCQCLETWSLLWLVEWFHQKDYPLHAKVGATGSTKC